PQQPTSETETTVSPDTSDAADPATATDTSATGSADLGHLHPDHLRLGGTGVFAGDWAWNQSTDGAWRIPVGFVGTLIDTWNGWAVFACTREVAEAIVADQQRLRDAERARLAAEASTATSSPPASTRRSHRCGSTATTSSSTNAPATTTTRTRCRGSR